MRTAYLFSLYGTPALFTILDRGCSSVIQCFRTLSLTVTMWNARAVCKGAEFTPAKGNPRGWPSGPVVIWWPAAPGQIIVFCKHQ